MRDYVTEAGAFGVLFARNQVEVESWAHNGERHIFPAMSGDELTTEQAKIISDGLYPGANYLSRLQRRMEKAGFPGNDPLYLKVCKARDAMQELCMEAHYLSCKSGVGRPDKE